MCFQGEKHEQSQKYLEKLKVEEEEEKHSLAEILWILLPMVLPTHSMSGLLFYETAGRLPSTLAALLITTH